MDGATQARLRVVPRERLATRLDLAVSESVSRSSYRPTCRRTKYRALITLQIALSAVLYALFPPHPLQHTLQGLPDAWQREHRRHGDHDEPNGDGDLHPMAGNQAGPYANSEHFGGGRQEGDGRVLTQGQRGSQTGGEAD